MCKDSMKTSSPPNPATRLIFDKRNFLAPEKAKWCHVFEMIFASHRIIISCRVGVFAFSFSLCLDGGVEAENRYSWNCYYKLSVFLFELFFCIFFGLAPMMHDCYEKREQLISFCSAKPIPRCTIISLMLNSQREFHQSMGLYLT